MQAHHAHYGNSGNCHSGRVYPGTVIKCPACERIEQPQYPAALHIVSVPFSGCGKEREECRQQYERNKENSNQVETSNKAEFLEYSTFGKEEYTEANACCEIG